MPQPLAYPAGYYATSTRDGLTLRLDGFGEIADGFDCEATAMAYAMEHAVERAEEAAADVADAGAALAQHVNDFLSVLDRGDFGRGHRFNDGSESAFVEGLRTGLAAFNAAQRSAAPITAARPVAQQAA